MIKSDPEKKNSSYKDKSDQRRKILGFNNLININ